MFAPRAIRFDPSLPRRRSPAPRDGTRAAFCTAGSCYALLAGVGLVCSPISGLCCVGPQQTTLKAKLGITEKDTCGDCMCTCICTTCAQCRIARELKARGIYTHEQMNGQLPSTLAPSNMTFVKAR